MVTPIDGRIVQRAILDVLQKEPGLDQYYKNATSFGGIIGRGVPAAIKTVCSAIRSGAHYFIKSDIEGFFSNIPRPFVLSKIASVINGIQFHKLLEEATHSELDNLSSLGKYAELFPTYEIGVAQGCCLSPLFGNILLEDFDRKLNNKGIICVRYIDDFIILGPNKAKVDPAFAAAQRILGSFGLCAYDPTVTSAKAETGQIKNGFEFLGCEILPGFVRPTKKSRQRLLASIEVLFNKSSFQMKHQPTLLSQERLSLTESLRSASNIIKGWGNQYSFCNDGEVIKSLDSKIGALMDNFLDRFIGIRDSFKIDYSAQRRRLIGVHLLADSKYDPIIK